MRHDKYRETEKKKFYPDFGQIFLPLCVKLITFGTVMSRYCNKNSGFFKKKIRCT